jgi:starch-binding outer membrane protein, SusD/RagB family
MVRNRAGLPDRVTTDPATARTYLRHERFIEFYGEGHRYYEMRRWLICNTAIQNVYYTKIIEYVNASGTTTSQTWTLDTSDLRDARSWGGNQMYWLPIWTSEMNRAPALVQNPGYAAVK